ncbi:alpha/beta fold hydrolase [Seonamhaeicola sediminis]|uniref:alpha/beta fold hydrolase n=1 Tax=Seonamhaeicola sediminis TaxID=2528206 RepID=UPI0026BC0CA6
MILEYKGITIFYTDHGKGSAIVLLHGFLENSNIWKPFIPQLSKKNRVVCIDLLGHGQTECLGYIHSMELMAEVVETVLKHLKIRRSIFVGHSMGGYVALAFAEKNPDNVKGLCLMNSTARSDTQEKKNKQR